MRYKPQSKSEFNKNYIRVESILQRCDFDFDKAKSLANIQANRITNENKCINRAMVAKELSDESTNLTSLIYKEIYNIFFQRAYELGSVSKQDFREYQLEKLGI